MSLQDLSPSEIIEVTNYWITKPGKLQDGAEIVTARPLIEKVGLLREMLPYLESAAAEITSFTKPSPLRPSSEIEKVEAQQEKLDNRHDALNRFLYGFEGLLSELLSSPEVAEALLSIRDKKYPEKLRVNKFTYEREAGAARLMEARLTPEDKSFLASITIQTPKESFSLLDLTTEVIEKAKQLGDLENVKQKLFSQVSVPSLPSMYRILSQWVSRVATFQRLVAIADLTDEEKEAILGKLDRIEAAATERRLAAEKAAKAGDREKTNE